MTQRSDIKIGQYYGNITYDSHSCFKIISEKTFLENASRRILSENRPNDSTFIKNYSKDKNVYNKIEKYDWCLTEFIINSCKQLYPPQSKLNNKINYEFLKDKS